nr:putative polyprotein [Tanacetum cinerariifolium]
MKSSTTNVETSNVKIPSNEEEVFHESSKSFQEESSSSYLNDDVQQSLEKVRVPSSNTQSISNNMIPNVDEASTLHNVFNERLEDAYFDASTSFHDPSNVHTFYQPYSHEKKWTKDHPLHKIIGDPKSSVQTRGQLANSCLFSCLTALLNGILKEEVYVGQPPGEMKFFLGLQVNQFSNGIFINQSKYILDILKRFGMENCDTVSTPMVEKAKLKLDLVRKPVDRTDYRSMIGSLMYVTSSRPDIMFATCM